MADVEALTSSHITTIGVGVILALFVIGLLLSLVITALIGRVIILVVVIVLAGIVWQQRGHIKDEFTTRACGLHSTFFGIHVDPPDDLRQACSTHS